MTINASIHLMHLLYLAVFFSLTSCSMNQIDNQKVLKHVVAFQFKAGVSEEQQSQAIQRFLALKDQIPEIKQFEGGEEISVEGLDKGFTHCYILTFENEAARDIYLPHPAHVKVAEVNKPLLNDLLVVDVWAAQ